MSEVDSEKVDSGLDNSWALDLAMFLTRHQQLSQEEDINRLCNLCSDLILSTDQLSKYLVLLLLNNFAFYTLV
jgi:hypothetical protein